MNKIKKYAYLSVIVAVVAIACGLGVNAFSGSAPSTVMENVTIGNFNAGGTEATETLGAGNYPWHFGDLTIQGALTVTGETTLTGNLVTTGITGPEEVETLTATTTLTAADSGKTFYIDATEGIAITLPASTTASGVFYKFVIADTFATHNVTITPVDTDLIEGTLIVAGAVVDCDASDVLTFVADGENLGDYVEIRSNGTKWFIGDSGALTTSKLTCSG